MPIFEIIAMRNVLMAELNAGYYDRDSWMATATLARESNCPAIATQMERYIDHYSTKQEAA